MSEKQEIKVNDSITVIFKTHIDDGYEPDFMGTFGRYPKEWCIDRKLRVLLGGSVPEPQWSERHEELEDNVPQWETPWKETKDMTDEEYEELETLRKEFDKTWEEWDEHHGLKVILNDVYVYHRYDSNGEYRYYYPSDNYTDETEENLAKYMLEDHKRYERLLDGAWCFLGYEVEVWVEGIEVASESLWGIESDMSRSDKEEVWGELLDQAFHNIRDKIEEEVVDLRQKADDLEDSLGNLPLEEEIANLVKEIE